jgi:hypothetical protein
MFFGKRLSRFTNLVAKGLMKETKKRLHIKWSGEKKTLCFGYGQ